MKEFKKIPSLKYFYEISKDGIVRNVKSKKILKPEIDKNGYYKYTFNQKSLYGTHKLLHQLIMECYGEEKPEWATMIDHIDRNKKNNNISNLRWVDAKGNAQNRDNSYVSKTGKETIHFAYESNKKRIYGIKDNNKIEFDSIKDGAIFICNNDSSKKIETVQRTIAKVIKLKRNYCYGYFWFLS